MPVEILTLQGGGTMRDVIIVVQEIPKPEISIRFSTNRETETAV